MVGPTCGRSLISYTQTRPVWDCLKPPQLIGSPMAVPWSVWVGAFGARDRWVTRADGAIRSRSREVRLGLETETRTPSIC